MAISAISQSSELVPQCQLHFSGAVYSSKDRSECAIAWPRVGSAENMPVECIDELCLQCEALPLCQTYSFYNRKVFVEILLASNFPGNTWHVAERISPLRDQT